MALGKPAATTAVLFLIGLPGIVSQSGSILPSSPSAEFPTCGLSCRGLNAASSACIESNPDGSDEVVNSCFCQRGEVIPFYESSAGVCDASCTSEQDRSTVQRWFQEYCAAAGFSGNGDPTSVTLVTSIRSPTTTPTSEGQSASEESSSEEGDWMQNHWQWVLMVIILFFGLLGFGFLLRFLRKRHHRRKESSRTTLPSSLETGIADSAVVRRDMWGPHQHMAHSGGWEYTADQNQEMRETPGVEGGSGILTSAIARIKGFKGDGNEKRGTSFQRKGHRSASAAGKRKDRAREIDEDSRDIPKRSRSKSRSSRNRGSQSKDRKRVAEAQSLPAAEQYNEKAGKERQTSDKEDKPPDRSD